MSINKQFSRCISNLFWLLLHPAIAFFIVTTSLFVSNDYQGLDDALKRFLMLYAIAFYPQCSKHYSWLFISLVVIALFIWVLYVSKNDKLLLIGFNFMAFIALSTPLMAIFLWLGPGYCTE